MWSSIRDDSPSDERALLRDIGQTDVGKTVNMTVLRKGELHVLPVTVGSWPRQRWEERDAPTAALQPMGKIPPDLGLTLAAIPKEQRSKLDLEEGLNGVLITKVMANSDAARRGAVPATSSCAYSTSPSLRQPTFCIALPLRAAKNAPSCCCWCCQRSARCPAPAGSRCA